MIDLKLALVNFPHLIHLICQLRAVQIAISVLSDIAIRMAFLMAKFGRQSKSPELWWKSKNKDFGTMSAWETLNNWI